MDIVFAGMTVVLAKSQPLLVALGLGAALPAVQLVTLAAVAIVSIMLTIGILSLMVYGLKKLTQKGLVPLPEEEEEDPVLKKEKAPEKNADFIPPVLENDNEAQGLDEELEAIDNIPVIVLARQKRDAAKAAYQEVVKTERIAREKNRYYCYFNVDIEYTPSSGEEYAQRKAEKALTDYQTLYSEELERIGYHEKKKVKKLADTQADAQYDANEYAKAIDQVSLTKAKVSNLEANYVIAQNRKVELEATPKDKRNPKVTVEYFEATLKIIKLSYALLQAKAEASEAILFAHVAEEPQRRIADKALNLTSTESDKLISDERILLQSAYIADKDKLDKAADEYETVRLKVSQALKNAKVSLEQAKKKREAKRAGQNGASSSHDAQANSKSFKKP